MKLKALPWVYLLSDSLQFWDCLADWISSSHQLPREGERGEGVARLSVKGYNYHFSIRPLANRATFTLLISISHRQSVVGLRPSSSLSAGCVVSLRRDWAIFCHAGSGRVWSAREKSLELLPLPFASLSINAMNRRSTSEPSLCDELIPSVECRLGLVYYHSNYCCLLLNASPPWILTLPVSYSFLSFVIGANAVQG